MKFLLILSALTTIAYAQRGSYAGSRPIGYPGLASRFQNDDDDDATTPLGSRFDGNNQPTPRIPIDARGDVDLVGRLNEWPRETRPFWILNADHIEAQRNPLGQNVRPDPPKYYPVNYNYDDFASNRRNRY